jgi:DNA-binding transcriptional regulator YdaS (Cro superfamily)
MSEPIPHIFHDALKRAVAMAGNNQSRFAAAIGTSQQLVSYWLKNARPLPGEYVLKAERAGLGTRYDLRPDLYPIDLAPSSDADIAA